MHFWVCNKGNSVELYNDNKVLKPELELKLLRTLYSRGQSTAEAPRGHGERGEKQCVPKGYEAPYSTHMDV